MWYFPLSAFLNAVVSIACLIYVLQSNRQKNITLTFTFLGLSVVLWSIGYFFWDVSLNQELALFWVRVFMAGAVFIPVFSVHFILSLIGLTHSKKRFLFFSYLITLFFLIADFTPYLVSSVTPKLQFNYWPNPGILFHFLIVIFTSSFFYLCFLLYKYYKDGNLSGINRNQVKYLFLAIVIGYISGANNILLWYDIPIYPYANILMFFCMFLIAFVMRNYMADFRTVVTRGALFGIINIGILFSMVFISIWCEQYFYMLFGERWWIFFLVIGLLLSYAGQRIYHILRDKTESEELHKQEAIKHASFELLSTREIFVIREKIMNIIIEKLNIEYVRILSYIPERKVFDVIDAKGIQRRYVNEEKRKSLDYDHSLIKLIIRHGESFSIDEVMKFKYGKDINMLDVETELRVLGAVVILPIFKDTKLEEFICLGGKKGREIYTKGDMHTLTILMNNEVLAMDNAKAYTRIEKNFEQTIYAFMDFVDAKDNYTRRHSDNVSNLMIEFLEFTRGKVGNEEIKRDKEIIKYAGLLHDIGKVGIPDDILKKPSVLTKLEKIKINKHAIEGYRIVSQIDAFKDIAQIIKHHHERWDGLGYPDGIKGKDIPLESRVMSVIDTYDAKTTDRKYEKAKSPEEAIAILRLNSGTQFQPEIVELFEKMIKKIVENINEEMIVKIMIREKDNEEKRKKSMLY
jgi:putative nucleotidyltransferase with HDIG domain